MIISRLHEGCRVGFFGLGQSNASLLSCLPLKNCLVTLRGDSPINRSLIPKDVKVDQVFEGAVSCQDITEDILIFSPSVRRDRPQFIDAKKRGSLFTSDAEIFFEENKRPIFAVTGSDGKSTTSALIERLLISGGMRARSVGNMGEPMVNRLSDTAEVYVAELSSFMLTYSSPRAKRACLTNLTPNHLDWHRSYEEYKKTKISLLRSSKEFVISDQNTDITGAFGIVSTGKCFNQLKNEYSAEIYITTEDRYILKNGERLLPIDIINRREKHNLQNLMMAIAMVDGFVDMEAILDTAKNFGGLAHRCECILCENGVNYIDSSIDTSPARTAATLRSLGRRAVVILGGRSKRLDFSELVPALKDHAEQVIITGENSDEIYEAIKNEIKAEIISDFEAAVMLGISLVRSGEALLLSPASASYDRFKNYAERGDKFREIVLKKLTK